VAKPARNPLGSTLETGPKLALHFGVVRQHIDQLVQKGVIEKRPDNLFDQDVSGLKYFAYLRDDRRRSPHAAASAEFAKAKTEWLALRIAKHKREHVLASEADAVLEEAVGITLKHISSIPALLYQTDLPGRRRAEAVILQVRQAIADECQRRADENERENEGGAQECAAPR
jgi:hypothetical protein